MEDIGPVEQRFGREATRGKRIRPDGVELCWQQIGILNTLDRPEVPFFVHWDCPDTEHPSATGGTQASIAVDTIELSGDQTSVVEVVGSDVGLDDTKVTWVEDDEPGVSAVVFRTANGSVRIDCLRSINPRGSPPACDRNP